MPTFCHNILTKTAGADQCAQQVRRATCQRDWLGLDRETFYVASSVAILPMSFCYPGTGKSRDRPPRVECAVAWPNKFFASTVL